MTIVAITERDIDYINDLIANIRDCDVKEFLEMGINESFSESVFESVKTSIECECLLDDKNNVIAIYGVSIPVPTGGRVVWALGTDLIESNKKTFIKATKRALYSWVARYGLLWNNVAIWNKKSIRWLKWLNASFGDVVVINGYEFLPFVIYQDKGV